jgi:hypothetical protein
MLTGSTLGTALFFIVMLALIPTTIVLIRYLADRRERVQRSPPATRTSVQVIPRDAIPPPQPPPEPLREFHGEGQPSQETGAAAPIEPDRQDVPPRRRAG